MSSRHILFGSGLRIMLVLTLAITSAFAVATPGAAARKDGRPAQTTKPQKPPTRAGKSKVDTKKVDIDNGGVKALDQVILDDLIVDGSICAGFDCVNGESFGFDTLRLKENNLRIKFQDTSTSASFPSNDWQLTANDSSNGGANKFSIDDITGGKTPFTVEAGARTNALYVEDSGQVGIGTNNPVTTMHLVTGNTPTVRLAQDGSSGFTAQTWDLASNEANFFIRDATNGSKLPFRIKPGAPTDALFIAANGNIGMGTPSPDSNGDVHIRDNGNVRVTLENTANDTKWTLTNVGSSPSTNDFRSSDVDASPKVEFSLTRDGDLTILGDYFSTTCTKPGSPCAPDFVFAAEYELMPIDELASFIEQNQHLPNVPSEDEFRAAGVINNSEFQMKLLEKIEELTLYTVQQDQMIGSLQHRLDAMEATILADVK